MKRAGTALVMFVVVMFVVTASLFGTFADNSASVAYASTGCGLDLGAGVPVALDGEAAANARAIIDVGQQRGVPEWGWVVAIATSLQETGGTLHNLAYGDRDSLGLFQQRPSQGWGTPAEVMDVQYAATAFYGGPDVPPINAGLLDIPGWQTMTLTQAAQAVQRSGFPDAYAQWQNEAGAIVGKVSISLPCATLPPIVIPPGDLGTFITAVRSTIGDWYQWGGTGPTVFDCSGLIWWAWAQAGHPMADRTAAQMWADSNEIPAGQAQPGDLLFSEFGTRVAGPGHVAVIVAPGLAVEAPHTGTQVREFAYTIVGGEHVGRLSGAAFMGGFV